MSGLKRDPTVILRIDGEDLQEFINSPTFEVEMMSIFSQSEFPRSPLRNSIVTALHKLGVEHGLPPPSDSWVMSNILEPALQTFSDNESEEPVSQDTFVMEFKRVAGKIAEHLKEQPVIVAHTESIFDGSGIRRLLANKFELEKALNNALETLPRDSPGKISKEYLHMALVSLSSPAGLPPYGAVQEEQMDKVTYNVFKMKANDDGKVVKEDEFKKLLEEILGSIMAQLEGNPITVSSSSVAHEPLATADSALLPTSS